MENKTKILIILDGSEENERSIEFVLKSNFFKFDEFSLFFILHPVNPVNQIREKQLLYHDFVHDHGRKLANMYVEKIQSLILSKKPEIRISHSIVNSKTNILERISMQDISFSLISGSKQNKLNYLLLSKNFNYFLKNIRPLVFIPKNFIFDDRLNNNLVSKYSKKLFNSEMINFLINDKNNALNFNKLTFLFSKENEKIEIEKFIERLPNNKYEFQLIKSNEKITEFLSKLNNNENLIFNYAPKIKSYFWNNLSKNSNFSLINSKFPIIFNNY
ncbi:MAG: hypothetical protein GWO78_02200 [Dehalococcoidales bacterium]|nr:hypothetical protein [Dehalococcoidales bacterium]